LQDEDEKGDDENNDDIRRHDGGSGFCGYEPCGVVLYLGFYLEVGGGIFLRNVGTQLPY
jgi:hypothetical protein